MKPVRLRYLSVDLFNTLVKPKENIAKTYTQFGQKHLNYNFDITIVKPSFVKAYAKVERKWPNFGRFHNVSAEAWWNEVFIHTFSKSSDLGEERIRRLLTPDVSSLLLDFYASKDAWYLVPGSVEGLAKLSDSGLHLSILSNSDEQASLLLESFGLDRFFNFTVFSRSCDWMKPDARIFKMVCGRFGSYADDGLTAKDRMLQYGHVGDSESKDYWGAVNAGCGRAFLLKQPETDPVFWVYNDSSSSSKAKAAIPTGCTISQLGEILERVDC